MKQTDFRDVPDELRERIEPLLAPFKRKRSGGNKPLSQRAVLAGILYKCRSGCQWAMLPALPTLEQSRCHDGDFPYTSCGIWGKSRRGRPMAGYGRHLAASADALSKKQRLRGLGAIRRTEGEVAARCISMWTDRVFLWV